MSTDLLGWGLLSQFPPFCYFPNFSELPKHTLAIEYHVHNWQVSAPVKYECDWNNLAGAFARSKILLTEKLRNGALVTPTPGLCSSLSRNTAQYTVENPCFLWREWYAVRAPFDQYIYVEMCFVIILHVTASCLPEIIFLTHWCSLLFFINTWNGNRARTAAPISNVRAAAHICDVNSCSWKKSKLYEVEITPTSWDSNPRSLDYMSSALTTEKWVWFAEHMTGFNGLKTIRD